MVALSCPSFCLPVCVLHALQETPSSLMKVMRETGGGMQKRRRGEWKFGKQNSESRQVCHADRKMIPASHRAAGPVCQEEFYGIEEVQM